MLVRLQVHWTEKSQLYFIGNFVEVKSSTSWAVLKKVVTQSTEEFKYKKHHKDTLAFSLMFVGGVQRVLKVFIGNTSDTKDFTDVNNKTIIFDKEDSEMVKNISDFGEKHFRDFGINSMLKQKYRSMKLLRKTISDFWDIWSMIKVVMPKTQCWHQKQYSIFAQLINIELKQWRNYLSLRFLELLTYFHW